MMPSFRPPRKGGRPHRPRGAARATRLLKERGAIAGDEIEAMEPIDKATRTLALDDGGLFPDVVAGDLDEPDDSFPLLQSQTAGAGES